ncbi:hypothetical protein DW777_13895 [Bacteroides sp. AM30-16]|jgi:hypothetical protein|uniref:hypothetical protein n=1 Tax=Bacteroides sp. AM30-16 TaxID=2292949 RepID=UPI000E708603|nr:hypothetical protein [Bacteroides sp. AM30-16]RJU53748.1 hypothetical protein DW777_13895 [Bacteroides sp. AM30-16]
MNRAIYLDRRKFDKFDDNHFIVYLNEETIPEYVPEVMEGQPEPEPCTAYAYSGSEKDGGTIIEATSAQYDDFVAGLVRLKFSQNQVEAILCNQGDGNDEHLAEYNALQLYRKDCKAVAAELLAR